MKAPEIGDLNELKLPEEESKRTTYDAVKELIEWADNQPPETFQD